MQQNGDEPAEETVPETDDDEREQTPDDSPAEKPPQPRVVPSVRPGLLSSAWQSCVGFLGAIRLPTWDLRLFGWMLLALIVIVFLGGNLSPMRLYFLGLQIQFPKTVAIVVLLAVGFLAGWFAATRRQEGDE